MSGKAAKIINYSVQQVAILAWFALLTAGNLVVRARAGCGKTTTIVAGVYAFIKVAKDAGKRVNVLATAFNRKIFKALEAKLAELSPDGVEVKGLNSLGNRFVKMAFPKARLDTTKNRAFNIARAIEPKGSDKLHSLLANLHTKCRELVPLATGPDDLAWVAQQFEMTIDEDLEAQGWTQDGLLDAAYECMMCAAKHTHEYDFADQVYLPVRLKLCKPLYDLIIVDETQDLSEAQLRMIQGALRKGGRFAFVGDDQQAIYGFRGADVTALDRLKKETNAQELGLTVTRRCPKSHVELAREIVADFEASPEAPEGTLTNLQHDRDFMLDNAKGNDFILSRTNAPLVAICLALLRRSTRAYVAGKDFGSSLCGIVRKLKIKMVTELAGKLDAWRTKEETKIRANKLAQDKEWLDKTIELLNDKSNCVTVMAEGLTTVDELLARIESLCKEPDESDPNTTGAVMCSTVHKAKGLESHTVWVCDGTFTYRNDEDERIRYVALTRSFDTMHLVKGFEKPADIE